jgi:hypothetical protein
MHMNKRLLVILAAMALLATAVMPVAVAQAQSGGGYDLTWNSIDGGAQMNLSGGGYQLNGTIGQPDAGTQVGGDYSLAGGFWAGSSVLRTFLPVVVKP